MKILLINQTFYPELLATSQQVADLALFLRGRGHSITVFTGRRGYEERKKIFPKKEEWKGLHIERIHSSGLGKTTVLRRIFDSFTFDSMLLLKLLCTPKFDLVISFTSPPLVGLFGTIFCKLKGGRSVQWLMDINPESAFAVGYISKDSLKGRFLNFVFEWTLKSSDDVVVLDRWMKEKVVRHGVSAEKVVIVPPWSVIEKKQEVEKRFFRKENLLEDKFIILYSGNHSVVHPLNTVLEAALKLRDKKDILFVFSGSGLRTVDVKVFRDRHSLENIMQLPWQPREALKDMFTAVDLHLVVMGQNMSGLVHTSKIYSVLSSGIPYLFVGPKKSHVGDLLNECPGGAHVEHGDVRGLEREILWFKELSIDKKREMGRRSQEYLKERFVSEESKIKFENSVVKKHLNFADSTFHDSIPARKTVSKSFP